MIQERFALAVGLLATLGGDLERPQGAGRVPFSADRWEHAGGTFEEVEHLGRRCLRLLGTDAWVKDLDLEDGILEFDFATDGDRSFSGVAWHARDEANYEHFYLRPHQSGFVDATQYTPVFHGVSGWQLYHGPGYGAPIEIRPGAWMPVRVVVSGRRCEVTVGDGPPQLVVRELLLGPGGGRVGLTASRFGPGYFADFRVRALERPPLVGAPPPAPPPAPDRVERWEVSSPFPAARLDGVTFLDPADVGDLTWSALEAEPTGITNLARLHGLAEGDTVVARVRVHADETRAVRVAFGYSDSVRVYANGQLLYVGDNGYQTRDYRYLGTIGAFDELWPVLEAGENELAFAVGESFGGWGLLCRIPDRTGLRVR